MPGGFGEALESLFSMEGLLMLTLGTIVGLLSGLIPGLGGLTGMAMFLPLTLAMSPQGALLFFAGITGPRFTGAITSILINIPGNSTNAATAFDGYPMARRGQADRALSIAATSSILGTIFGLLVLLAVMPGVLSILKAVGPHELFALAIMAVIMVAFSSSTDAGSFAKGIASGGVGLMIGFIGIATVSGTPRFNFGSDQYLYNGVALIALFIGVFAVAQVLRFTADERIVARDLSLQVNSSGSGIRQGIGDTFRNWRVLLQGSTIGAVIGILPGIGGTAANFLAYSSAKATSKNPQRFGKGTPEGIVAPESSSNSDMVASIVPTVSFGIPGGAEGVLILGLLTLHGFVTGPLLVRQHPEVLWILVAGAVLAALATSVLCLIGVRWLAKVALVPLTYMVPVVLVACLYGVYADRQNMLDVILAVAIGIAAYFVIKAGFSAASLVIGYVLAPIMEDSFVLGWQSADRDVLSFFASPLSIVLWLSTVALVVWSVFSTRRQNRQAKLAADPSEPGVVSVAKPAKRVTTAELVVTGLLTLFTATLVLEAVGLPPLVRLVPLVVGVPTLALLVVVLLTQARTRVKTRARVPEKVAVGAGAGMVHEGEVADDMHGADIEAAPAAPPRTPSAVRKRLVAGLVWVAAYTALIAAIGFISASVLAVLAYVGYDLVTEHKHLSRRQVVLRAVGAAVGVGVLLLAAQSIDLAMFDGLLFGERLPPV
jgi:putative tricarboxylic transport membrane protein